jgi:hypothetical protein
MSINNSKDTIEHRNRDFPTRNVVSQQSAPLRDSGYQIIKYPTQAGTQLKEPRRRSACGIKIDLKEVGWEGVDDLIRMAQDRN